MFTNRNKISKNSFFMKLALEQAKKNLGNTKENPAVGCIITKNDSVIAAGATNINGRPHAEHNAILFSKVKLDDCEIFTTLDIGTNPLFVGILIFSNIISNILKASLLYSFRGSLCA